MRAPYPAIILPSTKLRYQAVWWHWFWPSKDELQTKLHNARSSGGADLAIANILVAITGTAGCRLAAAGQAHTAPLGVIEGVISLKPELHRTVLALEPGQGEVFQKGDVPIVAPGSRDGVLAQIAEHARLIVGTELRYGDLTEYAGVKPAWGGAELRIVHHPLLDTQVSQGIAEHRSANAARHARDPTL